MYAVEGQVVKAQGPPLSPAEDAARDTLHNFMHQHASFLMHVLHAYCSQRRAVELLLLPEAFHDRIADVLASVRPFLKFAQEICTGHFHMLVCTIRAPAVATSASLRPC